MVSALNLRFPPVTISALGIMIRMMKTTMMTMVTMTIAMRKTDGDERVAQGQMETARPPLGLKGHTSLGSLCSVEKTPKSVNCLPTNKPTKLGTRSPIELLWTTQKILIFQFFFKHLVPCLLPTGC